MTVEAMGVGLFYSPCGQDEDRRRHTLQLGTCVDELLRVLSGVEARFE